MINVSETKKYIINPRRTIEKAFEGAYVGSLEKMPTAPPDYMASIWGACSVLFVGVLYFVVLAKLFIQQECSCSELLHLQE